MSPRTGARHRDPALLVLADGSVFEGEAFGAVPADGVTTGEAVFNTVLSGYQEVLTDPSYAGQIIAFTYPHIGNYGVNPTDDEAARPHCRGVIVRDLADAPSNFRSEGTLEGFLTGHGVPGITGIDTDASPATCATTARCRAPSARRPRPTCCRPPGRRPPPRDATWCPR